MSRGGVTRSLSKSFTPLALFYFYFFDRLIDGFPIETFKILAKGNKIQGDPHVIIMTEFKYTPATWLECKFCDDGTRGKREVLLLREVHYKHARLGKSTCVASLETCSTDLRRVTENLSYAIGNMKSANLSSW